MYVNVYWVFENYFVDNKTLITNEDVSPLG